MSGKRKQRTVDLNELVANAPPLEEPKREAEQPREAKRARARRRGPGTRATPYPGSN